MDKYIKQIVKYIPAFLIAVVLIFAITTIPVIVSILNEHTHSYGEWEIFKNPTCAEQGIYRRFCECGDTQQKSIDKLAHQEGKWEFNEDGTEKRLLCSVCSRTMQIEDLTNHTHSFGEWNVIIEPTCTDGGIMARKCLCGWSDEKAVKPIDHVFGEWQVLEAPTCEKNGKDQRTCKCGKTEERSTHNLGGHQYSSWSVYQLSSCTNDGIERRYCGNKGCSHFEEKYTGKTHSFGDWRIVLYPTYKNEGEENRICTNCSTIDRKTIDVLKYNESYWNVTGDGTLTSVDKLNLSGFISIAPDVIKIGKRALEDCNFTSVSIPDNVKIIEDYAFRYCDALTTVIIHKDIESIGKWIFGGCLKLNTFIYQGTRTDWEAIMGTNWDFGEQVNCTVYFENGETISVRDGKPQYN